MNQKDSTMKTLAFDASTKRRFDDNGFLHVADSHITKEQVVPYYGFEIPKWQVFGLEPNKIYYGYRPASEIEKAVSTANGLPLMLHHHVIDAKNPKKEYQVGTCGTSAVWNAPYLDNALVITDKVGIDAIESGECREISFAYQYDPDFVSGEFEGTPYDFVMRNIRGNHVALVENGRAGADVVVADAKPNFEGDDLMLKKTMDGSPEVEKEEVDLAQSIIDLHDIDPETGEVSDVGEDEDKDAKIRSLVEQYGANLDDDQKKAFADALADLAYSQATGDAEVVEEDFEEVDAKDVDPEWLDGELKKEEAIRARAMDAMKACGLDADDDMKEAFAKGFSYGMMDGERDMRNPEERKKLDKEHESEGMKKHYAQDAALIEQRILKSVESRFSAASEVESVTGKLDPMAFDSANGIYVEALAHMGIKKGTYNAASAQDMFKVLRQKVAQDSKPVPQREFSGVFEGLNNIK